MTTVSEMTDEELLADMDRLVLALSEGAAREAIAELARRLRAVMAERDASDKVLLGICAVHRLKFLPGTVTKQAIDAARLRVEGKQS